MLCLQTSPLRVSRVVNLSHSFRHRPLRPLYRHNSSEVAVNPPLMTRWKTYLYKPEHSSLSWKGAQFVDQTFTGVSQVMYSFIGSQLFQMLFIENTLTGVAIATALVLSSTSGGLAVLAGAALGQIWANVLKLEQGLVRSGTAQTFHSWVSQASLLLTVFWWWLLWTRSFLPFLLL